MKGQQREVHNTVEWLGKHVALIGTTFAYAALIVLSFQWTDDWAARQTVAMVLTGFVLIWYTWETSLLRKAAVSQRELQLRPFVVRQHRKEQAIERLKAGDLYQDNGLVFCKADGSYLVPSYVGQSYTYHIKKSLGIHDTLHGMRHAHGSILHEAGEDLKAIRDRLGHASVATTQRYIHASA